MLICLLQTANMSFRLLANTKLTVKGAILVTSQFVFNLCEVTVLLILVMSHNGSFMVPMYIITFNNNGEQFLQVA